MNKTPLHTAIVAALTGYAVTATPIAWSQESEGLEEIVVTATRREQNLQDVPLAVVAYTGEMLERQGIENMEDLKAVVPNLVVAGNLGGTDTASFTIRGIPNVGTYIDGIWQVSNNGLLLREFVDLERVEVLRGPQGTLYGRDSTGGAIRLYTAAPDEEFGVDVDMTVGNLDRRDLKASLDLPFTETFRSRFTVAQYDRDGYITSLTTGQKSGAFEDEAIKADFIWEPSDRFSVRFNAQEDEIVNTQARVNTYIDNQIGWNSGYQAGLSLAYDIASGGEWNCNYTCSGFPGGQLDEWEGRQDTTVPSRQSLEQQMVDVKVGITDNVSFQYLVGHTYSDTRQYNDWDAGEFNFYIDYFLSRARPHEPRVPVRGRQRSVLVGRRRLHVGPGRPRPQPGLLDGRLGRGDTELSQRHAAVLVCESGHAECGLHDGDSGLARHHELAAARRRGLRATLRRATGRPDPHDEPRRQQRQRLAVRV